MQAWASQLRMNSCASSANMYVSTPQAEVSMARTQASSGVHQHREIQQLLWVIASLPYGTGAELRMVGNGPCNNAVGEADCC
jgi:hypothetical protein